MLAKYNHTNPGAKCQQGVLTSVFNMYCKLEFGQVVNQGIPH